MGLKFPFRCLEEPSCTALFVFHSSAAAESSIREVGQSKTEMTYFYWHVPSQSLSDNCIVELESKNEQQSG